ncbi:MULTISPECIES: rhodanese-like domain-containing protein [Legionella]|uniref:Rhodanese-like domain-containing protein n=1 Tax=Legionella septentrionalis TaxID=2498109 RepID=A0A3S0X233_9GAMM|nr:MULTISPECIES: rhodanese-like domain-containing protein [Legionella]MCP0913092.1 rhodanese-like domain-containing protein [Legionella sp. 27cVA30]RUQ91542.1 rhodanese-like domain-containing protein [Legionella septentrionalis]RUR10592.1 rhodanese-like domain-containing protein [Legionella septentrionalis]RUR13776.1 rhodanese-like domain-containing protein [Legionella septentrionalis]
MTVPKINTINVHDFKKLRDTDPDVCLIDVREPHEWKEVHIPGAMHIPKDELTAVIEDKVPEYNRPIYLHCKGGVRSLHAAHSLLAMGYHEVYSIDGGIMEWEKSGYPVKR